MSGIPPGVLAQVDQDLARIDKAVDKIVGHLRSGHGDEDRAHVFGRLVVTLSDEPQARLVLVSAAALMRLARQPEGGVTGE